MRLRLGLHWRKLFRIRGESGKFSTGLVMSPEILNPEFKVGTLNPKTFASGEFCLETATSRIRKFFRLRSFEFAVEPKWRIQ